MQKRIIVILILSILLIFVSGVALAGINRAVSLFLLADYSSTIQQCKGLIAQGASRNELSQGYLLLGLSQMKEGQLDAARMSLRILIRNFPKDELVQRAHLALGDTYFLEGDFQQALKIYSDILKYYPKSDIVSLVYFRSGQTNLKLGNWYNARRYLKKAKKEFPVSLVSDLASRLLEYEYFFTIQVGSFKDYARAKSLAHKLSTEGHNSYITQVNLKGDMFYRVRIGKLSKRKEAVNLKNELSRQGYPTIIYP